MLDPSTRTIHPIPQHAVHVRLDCPVTLSAIEGDGRTVVRGVVDRVGDASLAHFLRLPVTVAVGDAIPLWRGVSGGMPMGSGRDQAASLVAPAHCVEIVNEGYAAV